MRLILCLMSAWTLVGAQSCFAQDKENPEVLVVAETAKRIVIATKNGDVKAIVQHTFAGAIREMGGKEEAEKLIKSQLEKLKKDGVTITKVETGKPDRFFKTAKHKFAVVPTVSVLNYQGITIKAESYLLGISDDLGKTWKFIDGAGLATKEMQNKLLPPLPEALKLPKFKAPTVVKDSE